MSALPSSASRRPASDATASALARLQLRWLALALLCPVPLWAAAVWLAGHCLSPWRFMAAGLGALVWPLLVLWRGLSVNRRVEPHDARQGSLHPEDEPLFPTLGAATSVTLARGFLLAAFAGFLPLPRPLGLLAWLPALLFFLVAALDGLDGYLARRTDRVTVLGGRLDLEIDAFSVLIAVLVLVRWGQLPVWYLSVGLARYTFVAGLAWRRLRGLPCFDLSPSRCRRWMAGCQMGFLSAALWPWVVPEAASVAAICLGTPLLLGFARDWLVVSGRLDPQASSYLRWRGRLRTLALRWGPVLARLGLGAAIVEWRWHEGTALPSGWARQLEQWGLPGAPDLASALAILCLFAALLLVIGAPLALFRPAALLLALGFAVETAASGVGPLTGVALAADLLLLQTGPGALSLSTALSRESQHHG